MGAPHSCESVPGRRSSFGSKMRAKRVDGYLVQKVMRIVFLGLILLIASGCIEKAPAEASLISASADGAYRVTLLELPNFDRNFEIWLERAKDGFKTNIFRSPDEGRPVGTERIIWSGDHSQFVLVGRKFSVEDGPRIPMETLYVLYDIPTSSLWCNANQAPGPRFTKTNFNTQPWSGNYENDVYRKSDRK
jgi:hypothetical protein